MSYDDLKQTILRKIDSERDAVKKMIESAKQCEDWQEIRDEITFIIQAYGSIMMIDRLQEVENFNNKTDVDEVKSEGDEPSGESKSEQ